MTELTEQEKLRRMVVLSQELVWGDLSSAMRLAINGSWSIDCGNKVWRIVPMARLVGPTPPQKLQWPVVASGMYEAILTKAGVEIPEFDLRDEYWHIMYKYGEPEQLCVRYAKSVSAMQADSVWEPTDGFDQFEDYLRVEDD